jgi:hypothetical protein
MSAARVGPSGREVKCEEQRRAHKFPFAQAMRECLWGITDQASRALGRTKYSIRTLETWFNFNDPQRGPDEVLATCLEQSLAAGKPRSMALAPLYHLCERFGVQHSDVVPPAGDDELLAADQVGAEVLREVGEGVAAFATYFGTKRRTTAEKRSAKRQLQEARAELARAEKLVDES